MRSDYLVILLLSCDCHVIVMWRLQMLTMVIELDNMTRTVELLRSPDGSRRFPAISCCDLKEQHPDARSGEFLNSPFLITINVSLRDSSLWHSSRVFVGRPFLILIKARGGNVKLWLSMVTWYHNLTIPYRQFPSLSSWSVIRSCILSCPQVCTGLTPMEVVTWTASKWSVTLRTASVPHASTQPRWWVRWPPRPTVV